MIASSSASLSSGASDGDRCEVVSRGCAAGSVCPHACDALHSGGQVTCRRGVSPADGGTLDVLACTPDCCDGEANDSCCGEARRTCADSNADGTANDPHDCSGDANAISAAPAGITCEENPCTDVECCTVQQTCADIDADGTANDPYDCSAHANELSTSPADITCAGTDGEGVPTGCADGDCCIRVPGGCEAGQRVNENHQCVACPTGSTNAAGDDSSGGPTDCDRASIPFTRFLRFAADCRACALQLSSARPMSAWTATMAASTARLER